MIYGISVITPPVAEPITLAEAKTHLRFDGSSDDDYITALINAARQYLEDICNRSFVNQTLQLTLADWPVGGSIRLPRPRAVSVTNLKYLDTAGALQTIDPANYILTVGREPAEILPVDTYSWPSLKTDHPNAVQVTYLAGYGVDAAAVPAIAKHAIKFLVAHLYENRETVNIGNITTELPFTLRSLIDLLAVREF